MKTRNQTVRLATIAISAVLITSACGSDNTTEATTSSIDEIPFVTTEELKEITDADLEVEEASTGEPVTTIKSGRANTSIYRGYIATLDRDEKVLEAAAPQPKTTDGTYPLTGLGGDSPARPAAVVKIDNGPGSSPQTGLDKADIVYEEPVEGGVTRFAAVFHSQATEVGPVRSGRTTDIGILNGFDNPLYLYSGANAVTDSLLRNQETVQNRNAATSSGYWRNKTRRAPSNLYSDLSRHWASSDKTEPPAQFEYRSANESAEGTKADSIQINYRANNVAWEWDGTSYLRSQKSKPHTAANGKQLEAKNVVVVETEEKATGMVDGSGATVPEYIFVGSNKATVFTDGKKIEGTWTRPSLADAATLTTSSGEVIELTAGQTWVEVIAEGSGILK